MSVCRTKQVTEPTSGVGGAANYRHNQSDRSRQRCTDCLRNENGHGAHEQRLVGSAAKPSCAAHSSQSFAEARSMCDGEDEAAVSHTTQSLERHQLNMTIVINCSGRACKSYWDPSSSEPNRRPWAQNRVLGACHTSTQYQSKRDTTKTLHLSGGLKSITYVDTLLEMLAHHEVS